MSTDKKKPARRYHNICRLDDEKIKRHAWQVSAMRYGITTKKQFSDSVYGGKRKALQAAIIYRDELLAKIDPINQQLWIRTKLIRSNTSGISGVRRVKKTDRFYPDNIYVSWVATWYDEHGVTHGRSFSVNRNGEAEAKKMAIEERERHLLQVCIVGADPILTQMLMIG